MQAFNPYSEPIQPGVNLIEASAGTGKTYTIAMLAVRFVVENNVPIEDILLVTFTKAATAELKERVRVRLEQTWHILAGRKSVDDPPLQNWIENLQTDRQTAMNRLQTAILDMDQAAVFTIHGFCQRILAEYALQCGQLFDCETLEDIRLLRQQCLDDFWRKTVYPRSPDEAGLLLHCYRTPEALLKDLGNIAPEIPLLPTDLNMLDILKQLLTDIPVLRAKIPQIYQKIRCLHEQKLLNTGKNYYDQVESSYTALQPWLSEKVATPPDAQLLSVFTSASLLTALKGTHKIIKACEGDNSEQKKRHFLQTQAIDSHLFDQCFDQLKQLAVSFRYAALSDLRRTLPKQLAASNRLSFDSMISRVHDVINGDNRSHFINAISQRFPVALIDEFQDTDNQQWSIFSNLFASQNNYLFLIGDPKQAIYKFRGADIYSYFAAQQQAQQHYTLDHNWRSHPQLVAAVNTLFSRSENVFDFSMLQFHPVNAARLAEEGNIRLHAKALPPMSIWQLPPPENSTGNKWHSKAAYKLIQIAIANEIIAMLQNASDFTLCSEDNHQRSLRADDIAILVRNNIQAREYQQALLQQGIPAVLRSRESVFRSDEAKHLLPLLQAVAEPGDMTLLKQALLIPWFDLDGQQLHALINDHRQMDAWLLRFQQYYQQWLQNGLMSMLSQLLDNENLPAKIACKKGAERTLSNILQLTELLQEMVSAEHLGIEKTVLRLDRLLQSDEEADASALRPERDEAAVQIVTMHSSKGLEYPVVFCPYVWQGEAASRDKIVLCHEQNTMIADLGSDDYDKHQAQQQKEAQAEQMRLLYVALTRAKYHCYLLWADAISKVHTGVALKRLLFPEGAEEFTQQQQALQALADEQPQQFSYQLLTHDVEPQLLATTLPEQLQAAPRLQRNLATTWQMSSYTGLAALSIQDVPELPDDKGREMHANPQAEAVAESDLPGGAGTGNVIHELLETQDFAHLASAPDLTADVQLACMRYGVEALLPEHLQRILQATVRTALDAQDKQFTLANLNAAKCLKEMPFYLSLKSMLTTKINDILQREATFQPLHGKEMQGFLTGFIDLVCCYRGRYYVMDYKSNRLPDYQPASLQEAMREHNYGLQYWIYTLVLHQYLQQRLPEYRYQQHFGGVRYLFVRGMQADSPMSGVFQAVPDFTTLQQLSDLFGMEQTCRL